MHDKKITLTTPKMKSSSNHHYGDLMMQEKSRETAGTDTRGPITENA
jgi:hypothetical protein